MTFIYTWNIDSIYTTPEQNDQKDVVVMVEWTLKGVDGVNIGYTKGNTEFTYLAENSFTPFSQITQSQVLQWIQNELGQDGVNAVKQLIQNQFSFNPSGIEPVKKVSQKFPWLT